MAELPFFPMAIDAYWADTKHLTDAEHGRYHLILYELWRSPQQRLPNNDDWLSRRFARSIARVAAELRPLIAEFCQADKKWIKQKRLTREFARARKATTRRREAAAAKWPASEAAERGRENRSARMAAARRKGTHSKEEWQALLAIFGSRCVACGDDGSKGHGIVKDHIKPIYQGGSDAIENIQPMCHRCNSKKAGDCTDHRQAIDPQWKRRLQDALGMPALTPTPTPTISKSRESLGGDRGGAENSAHPPEPTKIPPEFAAAARARRLQIAMPGDWQPSPEDLAWAAKMRPDLSTEDIDQQTESLRLRAKAGGWMQADWSARWRDWIKKAHASNRSVTVNGQSSRPAKLGAGSRAALAYAVFTGDDLTRADRPRDGEAEPELVGSASMVDRERDA